MKKTKRDEMRAWCPACRQQVELKNLRSWPEGVLVIGDCPACEASVASRRPPGWVNVAAPTERVPTAS